MEQGLPLDNLASRESGGPQPRPIAGTAGRASVPTSSKLSDVDASEQGGGCSCKLGSTATANVLQREDSRGQGRDAVVPPSSSELSDGDDGSRGCS